MNRDNLPSTIRSIIGRRSWSEETIGMTQSHVYLMEDLVLKMEPVCEESDNEHRMMAWLQGKLPVPRVHASVDQDGANYLLTSRLKGHMACAPEQLQDPTQLIRLLVRGLRLMWEVDVTDCPVRNDVSNKLRQARERIVSGQIDNEDWDAPWLSELGIQEPGALYDWLSSNRPKNEDLVFSHGDYCLPNVFFEGEEITGFVDLGRSGIADKWQDIALCLRSLQYNLNDPDIETLERKFFAELGMDPDRERIRYYLLLDELF